MGTDKLFQQLAVLKQDQCKRRARHQYKDKRKLTVENVWEWDECICTLLLPLHLMCDVYIVLAYGTGVVDNLLPSLEWIREIANSPCN